MLAGADHRVAVGLERRPGTSSGWSDLTRSTTVGSSASGSISRAAAARAAFSSASCLQAELQDRVRIEAVECPMCDERVVPLPTDRPTRRCRPRANRAPQPRCTARRRSWPVDRPREPALLAIPEGAVTGADDLVEERGQLRGGLDLDLLPRPDLRDAGAGARLRPGRSALPRAGRRSRSAVRRAGRGRARTAGTARRRPCRAPSSGVPRSAARRCRRSPGGRCGARGRARSGRSADRSAGSRASIAVRCALSAVELVEERLPPAVAELVVVVRGGRGGRRGSGCRGQPPEAGLDEVVKRVVEPAGRADGSGRGSAGSPSVDRSRVSS